MKITGTELLVLTVICYDDGQNCLLLEAVSLDRESAELNGWLDRSLRSGEYSQYCDGQEYRSLA